MIFKKHLLTTLLLLSFFSFFTTNIFAQENILPSSPYQQETLEGKVTKILEEKQVDLLGMESQQTYQKLEVMITKGSLKDEKVVIENGQVATANLQKYSVGDKLAISFGKDIEGVDTFFITDYIRRDSLLWLFIMFVFLVIIISRTQGLFSLFSMTASFLIIFKFILPKILAGGDPVLISIIAAAVIIPLTFFMSHGINKKTIVAIAGTLVSLTVTGILATIFANSSHLTGFSSEEASFLQALTKGSVNIRDLILAGIIIGVLGVLDDITVSQAAIVEQLKAANTKLKAKELYKKALVVGRDHIASMVNTLVLVYTGAALPLLLLFVNNPHPFSEIINYEIIAEEVVRTLVASIGLILAVPITTFLAALVAGTQKD